jgi:hypothetical protein
MAHIDSVKHFPTALACVFSVAVMLAPVATAAPPQCTQTGLRTTQCQTSGGSTQIVTSPPENFVNPWYGYGWGGLAFGFGGRSHGGRH